MKVQHAVILAAGKGKRLDRMDNPKALVRVGNKPLITHALERLERAGVKHISIVVGADGDAIKKELVAFPGKAELSFLEQKDSSKKGMLKSILSLRGTIKRPFYLTMTDLVFEKDPFSSFRSLKRMELGTLYTLVGTERSACERCGANSRVALEGNRVRAVGDTLASYDGFEVGIYLLSPKVLDDMGRVVRKERIASFSKLLAYYASRQKLVAAALGEGVWFDVNTPATHVLANMFVREQEQAVVPPRKGKTAKKLVPLSSFFRQKHMETGIVIERGLVKHISSYQVIPADRRDSPHFILTDDRVDALYGKKVLQGLLQGGFNAKKIVVREGEATKNIQEFARVADEIFSYGMDKGSFIISLGGGVVNNLAGVLASTLYRGIGLMHIATTMMSQVDAALDFKQAINSAAGKNLIGSYYPATTVFIDPEVLGSLDVRHIRNGIAESIKHALGGDRLFFEFLLKHHKKIKDIGFLEEVIRRTVSIKVPLLNGDVRNDMNEMLPQYGHAVGHAVEHLSSYELLHGEAVMIGACVSAEVARLMGLCTDDVVSAHYDIGERYALPTTIPKEFSPEAVCDMIRYDKHHHQGVPHMALPKAVGEMWSNNGVYSVPVEYDTLKRALAENQRRNHA